MDRKRTCYDKRNRKGNIFHSKMNIQLHKFDIWPARNITPHLTPGFKSKWMINDK